VNENHVLADFFQTGTYNLQGRSLVKTSSPSMDILLASNIERLLYVVTGDSQKVAAWMHSLKEEKTFTVDEATQNILKEHFFAHWVSDGEALENIKNIFTKTGYLLDPHTSVAQAVATHYGQTQEIKSKTLICATAHWSKFAPAIYATLFEGRVETGLDDFQMLEKISSLHESLRVPQNIAALKNKPLLHQEKIVANIEAVENVILNGILQKK
jgi:threonine synthase